MSALATSLEFFVVVIGFPLAVAVWAIILGGM
jgi:hypothetical protein